MGQKNFALLARRSETGGTSRRHQQGFADLAGLLPKQAEKSSSDEGRWPLPREFGPAAKIKTVIFVEFHEGDSRRATRHCLEEEEKE